MLREAERHQMLTEWNATAHEFPDGACLHELFERHVRAESRCAGGLLR